MIDYDKVSGIIKVPDTTSLDELAKFLDDLGEGDFKILIYGGIDESHDHEVGFQIS